MFMVASVGKTPEDEIDNDTGFQFCNERQNVRNFEKLA